jgi:hypothetical protein
MKKNTHLQRIKQAYKVGDVLNLNLMGHCYKYVILQVNIPLDRRSAINYSFFVCSNLNHNYILNYKLTTTVIYKLTNTIIDNKCVDNVFGTENTRKVLTEKSIFRQLYKKTVDYQFPFWKDYINKHY